MVPYRPCPAPAWPPIGNSPSERPWPQPQHWPWPFPSLSLSRGSMHSPYPPIFTTSFTVVSKLSGTGWDRPQAGDGLPLLRACLSHSTVTLQLLSSATSSTSAPLLRLWQCQGLIAPSSSLNTFSSHKEEAATQSEGWRPVFFC